MKKNFAALLLLLAFASVAMSQDASASRPLPEAPSPRTRRLGLPARSTTNSTQNMSRATSALEAVESEFASLQSALQRNEGDRFGAVHSFGGRSLLANTQSAFAALRDAQRLKQEEGGQFSNEYVESLNSLAEMLMAVNREPLDEARTVMLLAAKEDLEAKAEHLRRDPPARYNNAEPTGSEGQPRYSIAGPPMNTVNPIGWGVTTVVVRTRLGEMEVDGCEIWFVGRGWANVANRWRRFDTFSSTSMPPRRQLAPGSYIMWAKRGDRDGTRIPVRVGGMGATEQSIELFAPEP